MIGWERRTARLWIWIEVCGPIQYLREGQNDKTHDGIIVPLSPWLLEDLLEGFIYRPWRICLPRRGCRCGKVSHKIDSYYGTMVCEEWVVEPVCLPGVCVWRWHGLSKPSHIGRHLGSCWATSSDCGGASGFAGCLGGQILETYVMSPWGTVVGRMVHRYAPQDLQGVRFRMVQTGESIGFAVLESRSISDNEIKPGEKEGPTGPRYFLQEFHYSM